MRMLRQAKRRAGTVKVYVKQKQRKGNMESIKIISKIALILKK